MLLLFSRMSQDCPTLTQLGTVHLFHCCVNIPQVNNFTDMCLLIFLLLDIEFLGLA